MLLSYLGVGSEEVIVPHLIFQQMWEALELKVFFTHIVNMRKQRPHTLYLLGVRHYCARNSVADSLVQCSKKKDRGEGESQRRRCSDRRRRRRRIGDRGGGGRRRSLRRRRRRSNAHRRRVDEDSTNISAVKRKRNCDLCTLSQVFFGLSISFLWRKYLHP